MTVVCLRSSYIRGTVGRVIGTALSGKKGFSIQ